MVDKRFLFRFQLLMRHKTSHKSLQSTPEYSGCRVENMKNIRCLFHTCSKNIRVNPLKSRDDQIHVHYLRAAKQQQPMAKQNSHSRDPLHNLTRFFFFVVFYYFFFLLFYSHIFLSINFFLKLNSIILNLNSKFSYLFSLNNFFFLSLRTIKNQTTSKLLEMLRVTEMAKMKENENGKTSHFTDSIHDLVFGCVLHSDPVQRDVVRLFVVQRVL